MQTVSIRGERGREKENREEEKRIGGGGGREDLAFYRVNERIVWFCLYCETLTNRSLSLLLLPLLLLFFFSLCSNNILYMYRYRISAIKGGLEMTN